MITKEKGCPAKTAPEKTLQNQDTKKDAGLSSKIADRIAYFRAGVPPKYLKMYDRVISGKGTPRQAIRLQCLACWGWSKAETAACDNYACPLFAYRPDQKLPKSPTKGFGGSNTHENQEREV